MAIRWLYVPANVCDFAPQEGDTHDPTSAEGQVSSVFLGLEAPGVLDSDEPAIEIADCRVVGRYLEPMLVACAPVIVVRAKVVVSHDCTLSFGDQLGL
uniref:Uncharacterized protein n=1 Tax=Pseudomonas phage Nican01 TaxID=3138540 RepID=A0AAU6W1Y5_9CAUD